MPAERYYHKQNLQLEGIVHLEGQEHHHLSHVMRTKLGDEIELVNGLGQLATAQVNGLEKNKTSLVITHLFNAPPTKKLILAQAIPRFARLEFIMEKCTELGMTDLWLFRGDRSEKKELSDNQQERLQTLSISAMKQCGRLFLPKVEIKKPLKKWESLNDALLFFGDLNKEVLPFNIAFPQKKDSLLFFIGPESGFSNEEIKSLETLNAKGVKFNNNILRTDTAAISAMTLLALLQSTS